jgi:hypothetical protein
MATVASLLGHGPNQVQLETHEEIPAGANFGFEVELENLHSSVRSWPQVDGWELKGDGSLRDGIEYVFNGPQSGATALASINGFHEAMTQARPDPTFRCSTHLHMDVRDLEMTDVSKYVLAYLILEDVFFDHCAPERRQSNFCVPFMNNDYLSNRFGRWFLSGDDDRISFNNTINWSKYSALNLQTISRFGTVEFRGSQAIVNREDMIALMGRMASIKNFVRQADRELTYQGFVTLVGDTDLHQIIPAQYLRQGYEIDPAGKSMGISAALNALMHAEAARTGVDPFLSEQERRRAEEQAARTARQREATRISILLRQPVQWNQQRLRTLSLQIPQGPDTLETALRFLTSVNRLNGLSVTLRQVVTNLSNDDRASLLHFINSGSLERFSLGIQPEILQ